MTQIELDKNLEKLHQKYGEGELTADELYTAIDVLWVHITDLIQKVHNHHLNKYHEE